MPDSLLLSKDDSSQIISAPSVPWAPQYPTIWRAVEGERNGLGIGCGFESCPGWRETTSESLARLQLHQLCPWESTGEELHPAIHVLWVRPNLCSVIYIIKEVRGGAQTVTRIKALYDQGQGSVCNRDESSACDDIKVAHIKDYSPRGT